MDNGSYVRRYSLTLEFLGRISARQRPNRLHLARTFASPGSVQDPRVVSLRREYAACSEPARRPHDRPVRRNPPRLVLQQEIRSRVL
jgi:hypothetical protein